MTLYKTGESGNKAGRPPGAKNKITKPLKAEIQEFLSEVWPTLKQDFKKLEPAQRFQMFERMARFILPQPRETDLKIDFTTLSESEINLLIDKMLENYGK
jgi:hypothetical protein